MIVEVKTKEGIFDCIGDLLFSGRNNKSVYSKYPIGANNRYVYIVKSLEDGQIRAFYKSEVISIEVSDK